MIYDMTEKRRPYCRFLFGRRFDARRGRRLVRRAVTVALSNVVTGALTAVTLLAQPRGELSVMGTFAVTRAAPGVFGNDVTDGYLTQPVVMAGVRRGPFAIAGTLNFEGYTLRRGELNAGIFGEGYVDRRHPHTLVHELMFSAATSPARMLRASIAAGKGFTPFGTDDPMMRPLEKFPVNHHHGQIIERVQVIGALRVGDATRGATLEQAFFNGDEPLGPFAGPQWYRVGDSRTTRLTLMPSRGIEVQGSRAFVRSPGIIQGGAFDHTQTDIAVRIDRSTPATAVTGHSMPGHAMPTTRRYLLLEFARTDEGFGAQRAFRYTSLLAEGAIDHRGWGVAARAERTDRPENERLLDPFRTANGHIDFQILGITRWTLATAHLDTPTWTIPHLTSTHLRTHVRPFVEVSRATPVALRTPAAFIPREFYGAATLWSLSVGFRVHINVLSDQMRDRMGRYGVLARDP